MCYKLRNAFIHSGNIDEVPLDKFELQFTDSSWETGGVSSYECSWENGEFGNKKYTIRLDTRQFCFDVYSAVEAFYEKNKDTLNFEDTHIKLIDFNAEARKMDDINNLG